MTNNSSNKNPDADKSEPNQGFDKPFKDGVSSNFKPAQQPKLNIILATIKAAKDDSENPAGCLTNLYSIICSSYLVIVTLVLFTGLPIAMIAIGIVHINNCPVESKIPIWLIVFGVFGLMNCLIRLTTSIIIQTRHRKRNVIFHEPFPVFIVTTLNSFFLFIWFCIGNAWVFSIKSLQQSSDKGNADTYCNQVCYDFAFWSIISFWIIVCLLLLFMMGVAFYFAVGLLNRILFNRRVNLSNVR